MTTEELKEKLSLAFPGQLNGVVRPSEPIESDHDFFVELPQLISKDPVLYDKMNLILSVLLSNDKQLKEQSVSKIESNESGDSLVITDGKGNSTSVSITNLNQIYPVGSIYMSVISTNPSTFFGGTWEMMPPGRVLLGQGTSDWGITYTAGSTGGEATHTLTGEEMPSHNHTAWTDIQGIHKHSIQCYGWSGSSQAVSSFYADRWQIVGYTDDGGSHSHNVGINNAGGNQPHNNMQPYITVFMWKRTA